jgi:glycerate kinase
LGAGLVAFLGAKLVSGVDFVLDAVRFKEKLRGAHLVLTGEGSLDYQTAFNKAPVGVARMTRELGIPVVALASCLGKEYQVLYQEGMNAVMAITPRPLSLEEAMKDAYGLLAESTELAMRMIAVTALS